MTTIASVVYTDVSVLYKPNIFFASRSSLLYSGFRYTIELPLQPNKIQLYTFRVQGLALFPPWFPRLIHKNRVKFIFQILFVPFLYI